ncbi:MAG: hypothetical protein PWR06_2029 [Thermoanaerobacteraceae bacterium]|nr:hypothetical protein [Thermoanaerobacteraceae bacterium]
MSLMQYAPLFLFLLLFIIMMSGLPIAFCLTFVSIISAWLLWGYNGLNVVISSIWGTMNNFSLVAIPLFVFMALLLEKSNIVSDLYDTFYKWFGSIRGGLAVVSILVGAIVGAVSGVVAAGVVGLGVIALPEMLKYKYDRRISLGAVMAGGTLGQLIPPSLNMVVYGAITGVSVASLFAGGITSGLLLVVLFCAYILIRSYLNKNLCPSVPPEKRATWGEKITSLKKITIPALLILLVLGSILSGAATPTEGAAVGAFGAIMFAVITRRINWPLTKEVCIETLKTSSMVGWIIAGAAAFSAVFSGIGGNALIAQIAMSLPGGKWSVLALSIVFIYFLGMFLETTGLIMLAAPIVSPLLVKLGFDPLWWGIVFMTMLQTAFLSPPFGFAIFYLKGVCPKEIKIEELYWSTLPFIALQLIGIFLLIMFPQFAVWLPKMLIK